MVRARTAGKADKFSKKAIFTKIVTILTLLTITQKQNYCQYAT
jgi:hypothetical protein